MSGFLQLAFVLAAVLFAAKLAGYMSVRLGQPSVLGELIVGLILGPSLIGLTNLPFITNTQLGETITELGELGVLMLMFIAGLELHFSELAKNSRVAALAGILGVVFPVGLGWGVGRLFLMDHRAAFYLGLTLGATSVSISAQTLMELKVLRSRVGMGLLGSAVFDDILVILLLSAFLAVGQGGGNALSIVWIFVRMMIFLALSAGFGLWLLPRLSRITANLPISQGVLSLAVIIMLVYGLAAELIGGMAAITGAFIAGLMFARTQEKHRFETGFHSLAYGLFVPIFFVSIGLSINLRVLEPAVLWLFLAITLVAVLGKILGAGLGARLGGFTNREALQLGAGMVSRGEVGLIVGSVGLSQGLVNHEEFSAIVGTVLLTTLITPPMLRSLFNKEPVEKHETTPVPAPEPPVESPELSSEPQEEGA